MSVFDSNVNKICLGTDGAASSRVGHILPLQVEGSIPYSATLISRKLWDVYKGHLKCSKTMKTFRSFCLKETID